MDRKSIPGYYYDEEKKKFFKIQPGHQLPEGTTYSTGNVSREKRHIKRQKVEERFHERRQQQTVRRCKALTNPVVGRAGLNRELNGLRPSRTLQGQDAALIAKLNCCRMSMKPVQPFLKTHSSDYIHSAVYYPAADTLISTIAESQSPDYFNLYASQLISSEDDRPASLDRQEIHCIGRRRVNMLHGNLGRLIIFAQEKARRDQRGAIGPMVGLPDCNGCTFIQYCLDSQPQALAVQVQAARLAVRQHNLISICDLETQAYLNKLRIHSLDGDLEDDGRHLCPAIDWLSTNFVAFGDNSSLSRHRPVLLHDMRIEDQYAQRFVVADRITGIRVADDFGSRLLVSTNRHLTLFDTRMGDNPYLQVPHVHEGPELQFATNRLGLVAAVDRDNTVQVYSTWTGSRAGDLGPPAAKSWKYAAGGGLIRDLKWINGGHQGDILMACQGMSVLKWDWHGHCHTGEIVGAEDAISGQPR